MEIKGTIRIEGVDIAIKAMQEFREQAVFKADCPEEYKNGFNEAFDGMLLVLHGLQGKQKTDEHSIESNKCESCELKAEYKKMQAVMKNVLSDLQAYECVEAPCYMCENADDPCCDEFVCIHNGAIQSLLKGE